MLQRLDRAGAWEDLREERCCRACGETFTGREVEIVGGTRGYGPLRLQCPNNRCGRGPAVWTIVPRKPETRETRRALRVVTTHEGHACTVRRMRHPKAQPVARGALHSWLAARLAVIQSCLGRIHRLTTGLRHSLAHDGNKADAS